MPESENDRKNRGASRIKVFALSFAIFVISFYALYVVGGGLRASRSNSIISQLVLRHHELKWCRQRSGGDPLPSEVPFETLGKREYYFKDIETYYYPGAWDKAGRILLKHKEGGFYYVMFGDGCLSMLVYFSCREEDPNVGAVYIQPTLAESYNNWIWCVIPLAAITIAVAFLLEKKMETKSNKDRTSSSEE